MRPPHDIVATEVERAVLANLITYDEHRAYAISRLTDDCFAGGQERELWRVARCIYEEGGELSLPVVADRIRNNPSLLQFVMDVIRPELYQVSLMRGVEMLREYAMRRRVLVLSHLMAQRIADPGQDVLETVQQVMRQIDEMVREMSQASVQHLHEAVVAAHAELVEQESRKGQLAGIPTSLPTLDRWTGGMQAGQLWVLAGRPRWGKTALALQMGLHAAEQGHPVVFFSAEMTAVQLAMRVLSRIAGVGVQDLVRARWDMERIHRLRSIPFWIDDTPTIRLAELMSRAWALRHEVDAKLVIIDYLQLLRIPRLQGESRARQLGEATKALKRLARELSVPVLLLAQLNRSLEHRQSSRPVLADLRDSGEIEEDADVALLIWRPDLAEGATGERPALIVAKNRQGPGGDIPLMVDAARMVMGEVAEVF